MIALFVTVLCLIAGSHSAAPACEKLVQPLVQLDPQNLFGKWAFVAGSLKDPKAADLVKGRDSTTTYFFNSSFTQVNRVDDSCHYHPRNVSIDDHHRVLSVVGPFNSTGTFLHAPCSDCAVLKMDIESNDYKSTDVYLFSKRRELEKEEMEEFRAQVECLNMPPPVVMDPSKELCPEKPETEAQEEQH